MYFTDRGIEELANRRGDEQVSLDWVSDQLRAFVDLNPQFEVAVERLATYLARLEDDLNDDLGDDLDGSGESHLGDGSEDPTYRRTGSVDIDPSNGATVEGGPADRPGYHSGHADDRPADRPDDQAAEPAVDHPVYPPDVPSDALPDGRRLDQPAPIRTDHAR